MLTRTHQWATFLDGVVATLLTLVPKLRLVTPIPEAPLCLACQTATPWESSLQAVFCVGGGRLKPELQRLA